MDDPFRTIVDFCCCSNNRKNIDWPKVESVCNSCKKKIKIKLGQRIFHFKCKGCQLNIK